MKKINVKISGPCLLMHNGRLANPLDPYTKALKQVTDKKKKSDEDLYAIMKAEWNGGLYHEDEIGPYIPGEAIQQMLVAGARKSKQGKDFVSVSVMEEEVPLEYEGPRDREGLFNDSKFVDVRSVVVNGRSRVQRTRPKFFKWGLSFTIEIDDDASVNISDVERALKFGSKVVGIGDYRPAKGGRYGRFSVDLFEEIK